MGQRQPVAGLHRIEEGAVAGGTRGGFRAGIDRREQKKSAAEAEADMLRRKREQTGARGWGWRVGWGSQESRGLSKAGAPATASSPFAANAAQTQQCPTQAAHPDK